MAFDYKKEYKEFYMPKKTPAIVTVPKMNYIAVRGSGDPNVEDGDYKKAIGLLYAIAFTIKMSKKGDHKIEGYFDYVVPPLEGDPAPGFCDRGRFSLGGAGSDGKKEAGFLQGGVSDCGRRLMCAVHAYRSL